MRQSKERAFFTKAALRKDWHLELILFYQVTS
jgi:hypothetical protein